MLVKDWLIWLGFFDPNTERPLSLSHRQKDNFACAHCSFLRALSFFVSMATLTLENGTNVSSLSKANLELEILKLQPDATFHMPTRKHDLLVLLNTLIKSELGQRGTFGMLPDWRPIHLMPVATLRAEISTRHGSAVGIKRVLCLELERLNREALGLSPRTPSPGIEQSPLSPHATAFSPLAPPGILAAGTSPLGLEIPPASPNNAQQGGVSVFSPQAEPPAQLPLGSPLGLPTPPAALLTGVAGTTFTVFARVTSGGGARCCYRCCGRGCSSYCLRKLER